MKALSFRKKSGRPKETQTCNRMWRKEHVTGRNGALEILVKGFLRNLGISLRGREAKRAEAVFGVCVCVCGYMPSRFSCVQLLATPWTESESCSVMSDSLWPHGLCSPWNSPGQNTRVGNLSLPQGIFPTQELNPGLLHCRWIPYPMDYRPPVSSVHGILQEILGWIAMPSSRLSSQPRDQTHISYVSCIGRWVL